MSPLADGLRPLLLSLMLLILAGLLPIRGWAQTTRDCGSRKATFDFTDTVDGTKYPSLSSLQQAFFEQRVCDEVKKVEDFFGPKTTSQPDGKGWWQPAPGQPMLFLGQPDPYLALRGTFDGPFPDLRLSVSSAYTISESLVPAALGHRGQMQFPSYEAALDQSAIDHELTHVFFPNGNRLLAEGLAVYVQTLINSNPAFPNYGQPLDTLVRAFMCRSGLPSLNGTSLIVQLDKVSTPSALLFHIGLKNDQLSPDTYPVAGSFVKFLIEQHTWDLFHQLYVLTPLVPFDRDEGDNGRWQHVYNVGLTQLEHDWESQFAGLTCPH
jgi:hypothetical protein